MMKIKASNIRQIQSLCLQFTLYTNVAIVLVGILIAIQSGTHFFITADQRGQLLMDSKDYKQAAESFADPMRQGVAAYRAGEFEMAASANAGLPEPEAAFNRGNALVMLGKYEDAVASYDQALEERPDWPAALTNRAIAQGRADALKFDGGEMTGGKLEADEIVFDLNKETPNSGEEVVSASQELSDEELRATWLRQVQTTPGDFLKAKFAYQQAIKTSGKSDE